MTDEIRDNLPTVLVVDDTPLFQKSYRDAFNESGRFCTVYEAVNGLEAIEMAVICRPQIIILDIRMSKIEGIEAIRQIKEYLPEVKILAVTCLYSESIIREAFKLGIDAYCLKSVSVQQLFDAIDLVMAGGIWLDPGIAQYVLKTHVNYVNGKPRYTSLPDDVATLNAEETDLIAMIAANRCYQDISSHLKINFDFFNAQMRDVLCKLSLNPAFGYIPQLALEPVKL